MGIRNQANSIITATNTITTFEKFKGLMLDMLRGYPEYQYFGKFESIFKETGKKVVEILIRHKVIEQIPIKEVKEHIKTMPPIELQKLPNGEERFLWYRLAPRGVDLAVSMVNLDHSEKVVENSKQTLAYSGEMRIFTITIIVLGALTLLLGFNTLIFSLIR